MKVKFIYQTEQIVQMDLEGNENKRRIPTGEGHIFKFRLNELEAESLCGKTKKDIGTVVSAREQRVSTLNVCLKCAEAWKHDEQSEWHSWQRAVA